MAHGAAIAAAAQRRAQQTLLTRLRAAQAFDEAHAIPLDDVSSLEARLLGNFLDAAVVRRTGGRRYYLDEHRMAEFHAAQHQKVRLILLAAVIGVIGVLVVAALVLVTQ